VVGEFIEKTGLLSIDKAEILPNNDFIRTGYMMDMKKREKEDKITLALAVDTKNFITMFRLTAEHTEKPLS
jgi:hypothetical protein